MRGAKETVHSLDIEAEGGVADGSNTHSGSPPQNPSKMSWSHSGSPPQNPSKMRWWILVTMYTLFLLAGQTVATLLARLYYAQGGKSNWLAGFLQIAGFPILLPLYLLKSAPANNNLHEIRITPPSFRILASIYVSLGILQAATSLMYAYGYLCLPVSTATLICATQLAFNAIFSFFLNSLKFTPYIINSLVLLTISSILLVFNSSTGDSTKSSSGDHQDIAKDKYAIGFMCTLGASAGYGLTLSLTQFSVERVFKKETFKVVLDLIMYPSFVSACIVLVGLFASGEWKGLGDELREFKLGEVSYLMILIWTAVCCQLVSIGAMGLVVEVSALFSNVISTLGLPIVPVLAVIIFGDQMNGLKVIAMVLAIWGFISYFYNTYLEDAKSKIKGGNAN